MFLSDKALSTITLTFNNEMHYLQNIYSSHEITVLDNLHHINLRKNVCLNTLDGRFK